MSDFTIAAMSEVCTSFRSALVACRVQRFGQSKGDDVLYLLCRWAISNSYMTALSFSDDVTRLKLALWTSCGSFQPTVCNRRVSMHWSHYGSEDRQRPGNKASAEIVKGTCLLVCLSELSLLLSHRRLSPLNNPLSQTVFMPRFRSL